MRLFISRKLRAFIPRSTAWRRTIGLLLCVSGLFGFLPVVGFWMLPLGLFLLSLDSATLRKKRRQLLAWCKRRVRPSQP